MNATKLASATFEQIWSQVIDPMVMSVGANPSAEPAWDDERLDVVCLWILYQTTMRSGIAAFLSQEPPWMAARVPSAALRLGLIELFALWSRAVGGDPAEAGALHRGSDTRFTNPSAADELQSKIASASNWELDALIVEWVRSHPTDFASPKPRKAPQTTHSSPANVSIAQVIASRDSVPAYSARASYAVGDFFGHAKFGLGKVLALPAAGQMTCACEDGRTRKLVHQR